MILPMEWGEMGDYYCYTFPSATLGSVLVTRAEIAEFLFDDTSTWPILSYIMSFLIKGVGPGAYTPLPPFSLCSCRCSSCQSLMAPIRQIRRFQKNRVGHGMLACHRIVMKFMFLPFNFWGWIWRPRESWDWLTGWCLWEVYNQGTSFETKLKVHVMFDVVKLCFCKKRFQDLFLGVALSL